MIDVATNEVEMTYFAQTHPIVMDWVIKFTYIHHALESKHMRMIIISFQPIHK